jgi:tetratricopeptide (TPR) repeat protein
VAEAYRQKKLHLQAAIEYEQDDLPSCKASLEQCLPGVCVCVCVCLCMCIYLCVLTLCCVCFCSHSMLHHFGTAVPDDPDTIVGLGAVLYKEGDYEAAKNKFEAAMHQLSYQAQILTKVPFILPLYSTYARLGH